MRVLISLLLLFLASLPLSAAAQDGDDSAEAVVRGLYGLVTFGPDATPDWDAVRELFLPEAVVILRTGRDATTVFDVDGFIADFVGFAASPAVVESGFEERIVALHATEYGTLAHVWVLYEAHIPGSNRPPQQGVDSFQLARRDGAWRIVSIVNELVVAAGAPPAVLVPEER